MGGRYDGDGRQGRLRCGLRQNVAACPRVDLRTPSVSPCMSSTCRDSWVYGQPQRKCNYSPRLSSNPLFPGKLPDSWASLAQEKVSFPVRESKQSVREHLRGLVDVVASASIGFGKSGK